ncbi:hypothetical protein AB0N97_32220 [Streptomyces collinus]|uniref:hypothetical protein n=1 Tax=Streptomyces collinus TaxID=42684 RepID=UPI00342FBF89
MQHGLIAMPVTGGCDKDIDGERGFGRPAVSAHAQSQVIEVHRQFDARVQRRMFRFYAKAIHRNQQRANQQVERALADADTE